MPAAVPTTTLAAELLDTVGALRRGLRRAISSPWPGSRLTGAQLELLRLVGRHPGVSVREAGEQLRLAPNTVSTLVGQLGDAELLERRRDEADRRVIRLRLTAGAAATLRERRDERAAALQDAVDGLDAGQRAALEAALPVLATITTRLEQPDA